MPCYHPLQASFTIRSDGKKDIRFSTANARLFSMGCKFDGDNSLSLPCGKCIGCRLEQSRQWAVRCVHESSMYEDNCFITLTYSPEFLPVDMSLRKSDMQDFFKALRQRFSDRKIRVFYCGEYGDENGRPHYHSLIFNFDFPDKVYYKTVFGFKYFTSEVLSSVWGKGRCVIGSLTFESAAYVARYCTKKVTGALADEYYQGRVPEFAEPSRMPGLGRSWFDKFGMTDIYPLDECVIRGFKSKPPRYYDKLLEDRDPELFKIVKLRRDERRNDKVDDNSNSRLLVKERCQVARMKKLVRTLEDL